MPDSVKPVVEEFFKGLASTANAGEGEIAVALNGPNEKCKYTLLGGLGSNDPSAVERTVKNAWEAKPEFLGGVVAHNLGNAKETKLYEMKPGELLPEGA